MSKSIINGIFANAWEAELNHAEAELLQIERARAIENIVLLMGSFNISIDDISQCIGPKRVEYKNIDIVPFEPYFGNR